MTHGLKILNDCEENQWLLMKLPDWVTARWNRRVKEAIDDGLDDPDFGEFTSFLSKEARVACNPVSSLYALRPSESERPPTREPRRSKSSVLATTTK